MAHSWTQQKGANSIHFLRGWNFPVKNVLLGGQILERYFDPPEIELLPYCC